MSNIIDRRLNPRDKTLKNRKRFLELHKSQVRKAVKKIMDGGNVDVAKGAKRNVKVNPTTEPTFRKNRKTGDKTYVLPGNKQYTTGDHIDKPPQDGAGGGGTDGSMDGEGQDEFEFTLTEDEFMDFVFDELELPDFVKKQIKNVNQYETLNAGFKSEGNPSQLDIVRSLKNSLGRRIGLRRPTDEEIQDLKIMISYTVDPEGKKKLEAELEEMERRRRAIPWIDPFDIRYRNQVRVPKPHTQAVMFCIMDISYSMGEEEKECAKRFFMLLNLFLKRKYNDVQVIFIAHHSQAKEVDEEEFFYGKETGGTVVSTALDLCHNIIRSRYPVDDWNIYIAQASDGDNAFEDKEPTREILSTLLGVCQYFAYLEVVSAHKMAYAGSYSMDTSIWGLYKELVKFHPHMGMQQVTDKTEVWRVFSNLFNREKKDDAIVYGE